VRVPGEHGRLLRHLLHEQRLLHQLLLLLLLRRRGRLLHPLLLRMHAGDDRPAPTIRVWSGNQPSPTKKREKKPKEKKRKKENEKKGAPRGRVEERRRKGCGDGRGEASRGRRIFSWARHVYGFPLTFIETRCRSYVSVELRRERPWMRL
jgi:hypothetical protein